MTQWDYETSELARERREDELKERGDNGWELVYQEGVSYEYKHESPTRWEHGYLMTWKRPRESHDNQS